MAKIITTGTRDRSTAVTPAKVSKLKPPLAAPSLEWAATGQEPPHQKPPAEERPDGCTCHWDALMNGINSYACHIHGKGPPVIGGRRGSAKSRAKEARQVKP